MTDREAFIREIIENPEDSIPRCMFADWLDDGTESDRALGKFIRDRIEGKPFEWKVWRSNSHLHQDYPFEEIELDSCPVVHFTAVEEELFDDKANRYYRLTQLWYEWDDVVKDRRRCVAHSTISERDRVMSRDGQFDYARELMERRVRWARTVVGYLNRLWPKVRKWTFPDEITERPLQTLLLGREEAFALSASRVVRDYIAMGQDFFGLGGLDAYGLPPRLMGLNIVVEPELPPRIEPIPEKLSRDTMERWIACPRTYQIQD